MSVKTRTPYQAVTPRPWRASRAAKVGEAVGPSGDADPVLVSVRGKAAAQAVQSPSSPGRMASASPLRTRRIPARPARSPGDRAQHRLRIRQVHQHTVAQHRREGGNRASFGIIFDQRVLDPHPPADPGRLGGQVPFEPGQQAG